MCSNEVDAMLKFCQEIDQLKIQVNNLQYTVATLEHSKNNVELLIKSVLSTVDQQKWKFNL